MPTPTAMVTIKTILGMEATCSAKTWRSGSAIVIIAPIRETDAQHQPDATRFRHVGADGFAHRRHGHIDSRRKKAHTDDQHDRANDEGQHNIERKGMTVKLKTSTISVMGSTAVTDSASLCRRLFNK